MTLLDAALDLHHHGCSVVPVRTDGTKAPAVTWKHGQAHRAELDQLEAWFTSGQYDGLGVITGAVSGNLEMLEVEGRAADLIPQLGQLLADHGGADLWTRLCSGYLEQSPSGGMHWLYRVDGPALGNTKLARRPGHVPGTVDVLIETRGEGGFTVTAPSHGRSHPTGKAWVLLAGRPATIPTIAVEERDFLHEMARMLDAMPVVPADRHLTVVRDGHPTGGQPGDRPGDDYNARATWDDILTPHGWTRTRQFGPGFYGWTRPGKHARDGISATTGRNDADNLFVFSSSTEFETEKAYSKFAAYTLLEHHGDYAAAAKALRAAGYGKPTEEPRPDSVLDLIDTPPVTTHSPAPVAVDQAVDADTAPPAPARIGNEPRAYSLTDDGNALRLVDTHGTGLRYCPEAASWLRWDGHRWSWDAAGHVHELARSIGRALPDDDKDQAKHRRTTLHNNGLKGMVNVARTDPRIVVRPDQLDGRPYELNTPGGVVDLRTGVIRPPDPAALHTRSTTVTPDFDAPATRWQQFLADTFAGDPELTTYVQRLLGLSLIGEVLEQVLPFGWGSGANGKSTLLNVTQGVIGIGDQGYSIPAPADLLLATAHRAHPTELARLSGARLVVLSELEDGERFAEAKIKMLTGGDTIAARFMGKDFFSYVPTHLMMLVGNDKPAVRAGGPAFWRRLRLIHFAHVVPPEQRVAGLDQQLVEDEGPAVLAWLITGAIDYLRDGLAEPASVRAATSAYERDQDTVARFVEEMCERGPAAAQTMRVRVADLRQAYETWCRTEGETPVTAKALTTALTNRFDVIAERSSTARFYAGIRLTDPSPDENESVTPDTTGDADAWWKQ